MLAAKRLGLTGDEIDSEIALGKRFGELRKSLWGK